MAVSQLPPPQPFLPTPGEPVIPWSRWFESFTVYVTATGLDGDEIPDGRRRAVLLHCLGVEGQRICHSLDIGTATYEGTVQALASHFGPKKSTVMERYRFRQRDQLPGLRASLHYFGKL